MEERLELDISEALAGVEQIESALTASAQSFKVGLAEALDLLSTVVVEDVDASAVTAGIDSAVAAADTDVEMAADASEVTGAIDEAVDSADAEVEIQAVVDSVTDEIEAAVADADATVEVEADTSAAESAIEDLGAASEGAASGIDAAGVATENLGNLSALGASSVVGLESALDDMGTTGKVVAGVIAAVGTSAAVLVKAAIEAETADRRFAASLGDVAEQVDSIHIDGVAEDFSTLAEQTGNSDEAMKLAVARLSDLGSSAGASGEAVAAASEDISLLAIRASVMNPTLGDAGDVADRMTNAFARGGRALAPFGLALTSAEINARALADTGKAAAADLTIFDKAAAGAALATEQLGDSLQTDIVEGAKGTEIQLRILREEFGNTLEVFGQPLLEPVVEGMRAGQPILLGVAEVFGELGQVAIPLAVEALTAFSPIMGTTTQLLTVALQLLGPVVALIDAIPDPILQAAAAMALFNRLGGTAGLVGVLGSIGSTAGGAAGGLRSLPALIGAINPATAAVTIGVGLLAIAWQKHAKEQAESNARVREGAEAFADESKAITDTIDAIAAKRIPENQLDDIRRMGLTYKEAGELAADSVGGFDKFIDAAVESGEVTASVGEALKANGGEVRLTAAQWDQLGVSQTDVSNSNLALIETFQSLSGETQESAKSALEHLSATGNLTAAQQELVDAVLASTSGNVNYVSVLADVKGTSGDAAEGSEGFTGALDEQETQAAETQAALEQLMDAALGFIDSGIAAENAQRDFTDALAEVAEAAGGTAEAHRKGAKAAGDATAASARLADANRRMAEAQRDAAQAQAEINAQIAAGDYDPASDSALNLRNANAALAEAQRDAKAAQGDLTEAQREGKTAAEDSGAAAGRSAEDQRKYEDAVRGARDAAIDAAKAQVQLAEDQAAAAGSTLDAGTKMGIYRQTLVEAAAQASGPTKEAILEVIATLDAMPGSKNVDITANTSQARREMAELNAALERLGIGASLNIALAKAGGLMAGGSMQEGLTWVGEDGPELAHKQGSRVEVFSAQRSREMLPSQGAALDTAALAAAIAAEVGRLRPNQWSIYESANPEATAEAVSVRLGYGAER